MKSKFKNLNFDSIEVLSRKQQMKIVGGYEDGDSSGCAYNIYLDGVLVAQAKSAANAKLAAYELARQNQGTYKSVMWDTKPCNQR